MKILSLFFLLLGFILGFMWFIFDFEPFIGLIMVGSFILTFIFYKIDEKKEKEIVKDTLESMGKGGKDDIMEKF